MAHRQHDPGPAPSPPPIAIPCGREMWGHASSCPCVGDRTLPAKPAVYRGKGARLARGGPSTLEAEFHRQLWAVGLREWVAEYRFIPPRKYRFDIAFLKDKLAIEIDGGMWVASRHRSGKGYTKDVEKGNLAVLSGWRVLHGVASHVHSGELLQWTLTALAQSAPSGPSRDIAPTRMASSATTVTTGRSSTTPAARLRVSRSRSAG